MFVQDKNKHFTDLQNMLNHLEFSVGTMNNRPLGVIPATVAHFYEFQHILCALDLLLLEPYNLHLLFPVLQHPQLSFTIQQVKHLIVHTHSKHWLMFYSKGGGKQIITTTCLSTVDFEEGCVHL